MHEPTYNHFDKLLPKYQRRFRNGYNTQQFLIAKWLQHTTVLDSYD